MLYSGDFGKTGARTSKVSRLRPRIMCHIEKHSPSTQRLIERQLTMSHSESSMDPRPNTAPTKMATTKTGAWTTKRSHSRADSRVDRGVAADLQPGRGGAQSPPRSKKAESSISDQLLELSGGKRSSAKCSDCSCFRVPTTTIPPRPPTWAVFQLSWVGVAPRLQSR